jgi:hypothetical protein
MRHGQRILIGYETQSGIPAEETQQHGPFGTQRCHLNEPIWSRFIPDQPAVLDVYVSQPGTQLVSVHGVLSMEPVELQLRNRNATD